MKQIIQIDKIEKAKPQKGIWFDYYGDIFISVIPLENKKHIRRKAKLTDNKKDNEMSIWHLKWQYELIEDSFGMSNCGHKTYERVIEVDKERHIIDSLVANQIAIEFQHTLSVSLDEMDSRVRAHEKFGFTPYLVLDFTTFKLSEFINNDERLEKKLKKWLKSIYYKKNNLFIDLEDSMVRLSPNVIGGQILINQDKFIEDLLMLEESLAISISIFNNKKAKEEEERRINEKIAEERQKEREEYYLQIKKEENREEKFKNNEYKYFRKCYRDKVILPFILEYAKDLFKYQNIGVEVGENYYEKYHSFFSQERDFVIHYINVSHFEDVVYATRWGLRKKRKFTYLYSHVEVYIGDGYGGIKHKFEFEKGKTIKEK